MDEEMPENHMLTPTTFVVEPVPFQAMQWDGTEEQALQIVAWIESHEGHAVYVPPGLSTGNISIGSDYGLLTARPNDWLLHNYFGEKFSVRTKGAFEDLYVPLSAIYDMVQKYEDSVVPRLTEKQAAIMMAFTGISCGPFELFHKYAQEKLDRPVWTHEFATEERMAEIKEASRDDFLSICCLKKYDNE